MFVRLFTIQLKSIEGDQLQGDPNQNPLFQMAVALRLCISNPMLVKPKLV